jgi:hypothetical protein
MPSATERPIEFPLRPDDCIVESIMFAKMRRSSLRHLSESGIAKTFTTLTATAVFVRRLCWLALGSGAPRSCPRERAVFARQFGWHRSGRRRQSNRTQPGSFCPERVPDGHFFRADLTIFAVRAAEELPRHRVLVARGLVVSHTVIVGQAPISFLHRRQGIDTS